MVNEDKYVSMLEIGLVPTFSRVPMTTFIDYDPITGVKYEVLGHRVLTPEEIQTEKDKIRSMK